MKRLAQLFISVLFVITVSTVYFAFDLAVTSMVKPKKYSIDRHDDHRLHRTSTMLSLTSLKPLEENLANHRTNHSKRKHRQGKGAPFHKSRTGVKINAKGQEKLRLRNQNKLDSHRPPL